MQPNCIFCGSGKVHQLDDNSYKCMVCGYRTKARHLKVLCGEKTETEKKGNKESSTENNN